jgi:hypothetical protein
MVSESNEDGESIGYEQNKSILEQDQSVMNVSTD